MRTHARALLPCLLCALAACGRLGVEVLAALDASGAHPTPDAGAPPLRDAGKLMDAGRDGSVYEGDSGRVDAGCVSACAVEHGSVDCSAGVCQVTCQSGYADCDTTVQNGCEVDLNASVTACGGCGVACDTSFQVCSDGSCQVSMCPVGRGDCDSVTSDCETDLTSSVAHCSACGQLCAAAHATPGCTAGACEIASCDNGYADCDLTAANGCESERAVDAANCGGCGIVCPNAMANASAVCNAGACGYSCTGLSGVYALRLDAQASWPTTNFIRADSGALAFWLRLTLTQAGTALTASAQLCDQVTPDESNTTTADQYLLSYPAALFTPGAPAAAFSATLASLSPGAALSSTRAAHVLGVTLADPLNGAWPNVATARTNQVNHDGDMDVGITVAFVDDATYNHAQVDSSVFGGSRASHAYGVQRLRFSLAGALSACSAASGPATTVSFETRTIGCRLESGNDCNSTQYNYVDDNTIAYTINSSSYTLTRLGATGSSFTCAQVRAAL